MKTIMILGFGEVGSSVYTLYKEYTQYNVVVKEIKDIEDVTMVLPSQKIDILHVCLPYNKQFIDTVILNIKEHTPLLTVIHSTVPPYTTANIHDKHPCNIVHSPVMGLHPNLTKSIQTFKKIIGGVTPEASNLAIKHFNELGIETVKYKSSNESEVSKLLSTTYYAWNIIFMKNVKRFCIDYGLEFEEVYRLTNEIYNEGYEKMGNKNVMRPVLKYMSGKIGGHCLRPNMELMTRVFYPADLLIEMDDDDDLQ